jgi:hypothetical protein
MKDGTRRSRRGLCTRSPQGRPEVKIIATSGGGRIGLMRILDIAHKLGADTALGKPSDASELIAMICGMLDRLTNDLRRAAHECD